MNIRILMFSADWCQPCKIMKPIIKDFEKDYNIEYIDIEKELELVSNYQITNVPSFIKLENDIEVSRSVGAMNKEKFKQFLLC